MVIKKKFRNCNILSICLNLFFYIVLGVLILVLIYPYTSFYFEQSLFSSMNGRLNVYDVVLTKGDSFRLYPLDFYKSVRYSSSDFKVAEVNNTGKVVGRRIGQAIIKVKTNKRIMKCRVTVIGFKENEVALVKGEKKMLKVLGTNGWIKWKSTDKQIVTVSRFGRVKAIKKGTALVIACIKGREIKCKIEVK